MGLIEDISRFLETRLEEFISNNPQIELQILEDKLRQQEEEIEKLIITSKQEEKNLQERILEIAEEIRVWHDRTVKAESFDRPDLANLAKEREAALLRQGNQIWAQMNWLKNGRSIVKPYRCKSKNDAKRFKLKLPKLLKPLRSSRLLVHP